MSKPSYSDMVISSLVAKSPGVFFIIPCVDIYKPKPRPLTAELLAPGVQIYIQLVVGNREMTFALEKPDQNKNNELGLKK